MDWIKTSNELPPKDGFYQCTNQPDNPFDLGSGYYDGIGFSYFDIYRSPKYWRHMPDLEKKYGKQNDNDTPQDQEAPRTS